MTRSDVQIERLSARATRFLSTLSHNGRIRRALDQGGYTPEDHEQGWSLLLALLGYTSTAPLPADEPTAPAAAALAELDRWDGPSFARARAALTHMYPEQAEYVFAGLSAKPGAESVGAVRTFLDRVAVLRSGSDPARKASKVADRAAAELLAKRRILDAEIEARLRALIDTATALAPATVEAAPPEPDDRLATAQRLGAWLNDWRETARVIVTRRSDRIALGLAQRRTRAKDAAGSEVDVEAAEAPT